MLHVMLKLCGGMQSFMKTGKTQHQSKFVAIDTTSHKSTVSLCYTGTDGRAQEAKILTTRTDCQSNHDPKHEEFWEKVELPGVPTTLSCVDTTAYRRGLLQTREVYKADRPRLIAS